MFNREIKWLRRSDPGASEKEYKRVPLLEIMVIRFFHP
jgi:hypothetical protein